MRYILSEIQYHKLINEQDESKWLYDWFKNVPEDKIKNTFTRIEVMPITTFSFSKGSNNFTKTTSFDKKQILNFLSKGAEIVKVPIEEFMKLGHKGSLAMYVEQTAKQVIPQNIEKIKKTISEIKNLLNSNPKSIDLKQSLKEADDMLHLYEKLAEYSGKIVIPENYLERSKDSKLGSREIIGHEMVHYLYDMTKESAKEVIKKICSNSKCEKYFKEETEVYAYLFTLRSKFNMMPTDIIKSVSTTKGKENSRIEIIIDRNGKNYTITNFLPTESATFKALKCCTGNFGDSLKKLHNTLAYNSTRTSNIA